MLTLITLLSAVVAVALSAGCCTPPQWEGAEGIQVGYSGFIKSGLIKEYVKVAYDGTNRRTASELYYRNGKVKGKFQIVVRYDDEKDENKGMLYFVDLEKSSCYKRALKYPFRKACIPDSAEELGDYYVGLKGGMKATGYQIDGEGYSNTISVSKLDNGLCVPIGEVVSVKKRLAATMRSVGFINITPGITNATVFDVPAACKEVEYYDIMDELSREHYVFAL